MTSYLFPAGRFDLARLRALSAKVGREKLVVDIRYISELGRSDQSLS